MGDDMLSRSEDDWLAMVFVLTWNANSFPG